MGKRRRLNLESSMKKFGLVMGAAAAAVAMSSAAHAETTISGNVALTTDYKFRGISQTGSAPAIQGGFDIANGMFYAGTWASNVNFDEVSTGTVGLRAQTEIDLYAGIKPTWGPVSYDFGVIGYFYPSANEKAVGLGDLDYVEGYAKAFFTVAEKLGLGASFFYSPEFTGETGNAYYIEGTASYPLSETVSVSGGVGYQDVDDPSGKFTSVTGRREQSDSYTTWNLGGTATVHGFGLDLRYVDTDIDKSSFFVRDAFTTEARGEGSVIFTVKRAL